MPFCDFEMKIGYTFATLESKGSIDLNSASADELDQ